MPILNFRALEGLDRVPAGHLKAVLSCHVEGGAPVDADAVLAVIARADLTDADIEELVWIADMGQVHFMSLGFDDMEAMAVCDEYRKVSEFLEAMGADIANGSR